MRISDLVNKVEEFRFEYDGFVLEGEFYKYKTTTPSYAKNLRADMKEVPEGASDEEKRRIEDDNAVKIGARMLADLIKSWNAADDSGPVLPSMETFESLPAPFTTKFLEYIQTLRDGNPMNGNGLPTGSPAS